MKRLIVLALAILACIAASAPCAFAGIIECSSTKPGEAHFRETHGNPFAHAVTEASSVCAFNILSGSSGPGSIEWEDRLLASAAAGLFGTSLSEKSGATFYFDSKTLCVAASNIRHVRAFPQDQGHRRLSLGAILSASPEEGTSAPRPGLMFLAGIGLIGLSVIRKRKGSTRPRRNPSALQSQRPLTACPRFSESLGSGARS